MQKITLLLFFLLIAKTSFSQESILSEKAEISVLTIGPGVSLNDAFGHNAFRIKDPILGEDMVFDYGVYNFSTPNFYLKFAQGKLNYFLGLSYYADFYNAYVNQNRTVKEQVLNLSKTEKQKLFDYLINNYKPENRAYLYDFFFDNCATKIKDVAQISLNNTIVFNTSEQFSSKTFRTLIHNNLNQNSWGSLGIDIALGSVIDRKATAEQHMFLPEYIYTFFENATIKGTNKPLVKDSHIVYTKIETPVKNSFFSSPLFIFGIVGLFILYITYRDYKNQKRSKWLDVILFLFTGFTGIGILLLWFATDHKGTHQNYNLLWACALNLLVVWQLLKTQTSNWVKKYLKFLVILLGLLVVHWLTGVQIFAIGLIPLLMALFFRYLYLIYSFNKENSKE
ncbi:MAG: DUF4105 domain-containing protein [Aestuariibaculum sp.]